MINIILNDFRNRKKYIIFGTLIMLVIYIYYTLLNFYNYYDYYIVSILGSQKENRGIEVFIDKESVDSFFLNNEKIEKYTPIYNNQYLKYDNQSLSVNYYDEEDIIYGKKNINDNEILVSNYAFKFLHLSYDDINNKTMSLEINNNIYDFTIIGIVNNNKSQIYMSINDFENLYELIPNTYYVLIKKYNDVNNYIKLLNNDGFLASLYDTSKQNEINALNQIQNIYAYILLIANVIGLIFISSIIKNIILQEEKNIAILKATGYRINNIVMIILFRFITIIFFAYLFIIINNIFLYHLLKNFLYLNFLNINIICKQTTMITIIILIIVILNINKLKRRIKKMDVLDILQDY